jgi:hypothetical protein
MTGNPPNSLLARLKTAAGADATPRERVLAHYDEIRAAVDQNYTYRSIYAGLADNLGDMSYYAFCKLVQRHVVGKPANSRGKKRTQSEAKQRQDNPPVSPKEGLRTTLHLDKVKGANSPDDPHEGYLKPDDMF